MPHSIPKSALEVTISVRWEGGDRTFHMALPHDDILASSAGDALLAKSLEKKIKVSFEHWRKLEVQLTHVWNNGQSQVIYSHSSITDHEKAQGEVIEMLSWWQQHACMEPRSVRMMLVLNIDTAGVHMLPVRPKLLSIKEGIQKNSSGTETSASSPESTLRVFKTCDEENKESESEVTFDTIIYSNATPISKESTAVEEEPEPQVSFDRSNGKWKRIVFSRTSS